ncbi:hypothetical protein ACFX1R_011763 [Malus domestica]
MKAMSFQFLALMMILKFDFENAYFVTVTYLYRLNETFLVGIFTSAIYTEDCIFEDPTIIRHAETESWNVSGRLFTPAYGRSNDRTR